MLSSLGIKDLYPLALAEGEGVGTAYEYYAKRNLLKKWLVGSAQPQHILIAGLPEKYGTSLDFLLLAKELNANVTVLDDRPQALDKLSMALKEDILDDRLPGQTPEFLLVENLNHLELITGNFDLILSSETLQRLSGNGRSRYFKTLLLAGNKLAFFTPNGDNTNHTDISGLSGLRLEDYESLIKQSAGEDVSISAPIQSGYIDMPPFPPGITRTEEQREQATSGAFESIAMWGLGFYANLERFFPHSLKKSQAHIVYALIEVN